MKHDNYLTAAAELAQVPETWGILATVFDELATADSQSGRRDPKFTLDYLAARKGLLGPTSTFDCLASVAHTKNHVDHLLSWKDNQGKVMCAAVMARRLMADGEELYGQDLDALIRSMSEDAKSLWAAQEESEAVKAFVKAQYASAWGA